MNHEDWKEKVLSYGDGSLSITEKEMVERHLSECEECTRDLLEYQGLIMKLRASFAPASEANEHFVERVMDEIKRTDFQMQRHFAWKWFAPAFGLAGFLVLVTFFNQRTPVGIQDLIQLESKWNDGNLYGELVEISEMEENL